MTGPPSLPKQESLQSASPYSLPQRIELSIVWSLTFILLWIVIVFGIPGIALYFSSLMGKIDDPTKMLQKTWEWLFLWSYPSALPGAWVAGIVAHRGFRDVTKEKLSQTIFFSTAIIATTGSAMFIAGNAAQVLRSDLLAMNAGIFLVSSGFVWFATCLPSWYVSRSTFSFLRVLLDRTSATPIRILTLYLVLLSAYSGSYVHLRQSGEIQFKQHLYITGGGWGSTWSKDHIRTSSKTLEWVYWLPAELELTFSNPFVTQLSPDERG